MPPLPYRFGTVMAAFSGASEDYKQASLECLKAPCASSTTLPSRIKAFSGCRYRVIGLRRPLWEMSII